MFALSFVISRKPLLLLLLLLSFVLLQCIWCVWSPRSTCQVKVVETLVKQFIFLFVVVVETLPHDVTLPERKHPDFHKTLLEMNSSTAQMLHLHFALSRIQSNSLKQQKIGARVAAIFWFLKENSKKITSSPSFPHGNGKEMRQFSFHFLSVSFSSPLSIQNKKTSKDTVKLILKMRD